MNFINEITRYRHTKIDPHDLKVNHKQLPNPEEIAETFNNYFSFKENDVIKSKSQNKLSRETKAKYYLNQNDKPCLSPLVLKAFSTREISSIIKSIKTKIYMDMMKFQLGYSKLAPTA